MNHLFIKCSFLLIASLVWVRKPTKAWVQEITCYFFSCLLSQSCLMTVNLFCFRSFRFVRRLCCWLYEGVYLIKPSDSLSIKVHIHSKTKQNISIVGISGLVEVGLLHSLAWDGCGGLVVLVSLPSRLQWPLPVRCTWKGWWGQERQWWPPSGRGAAMHCSPWSWARCWTAQAWRLWPTAGGTRSAPGSSSGRGETTARREQQWKCAAPIR